MPAAERCAKASLRPDGRRKLPAQEVSHAPARPPRLVRLLAGTPADKVDWQAFPDHPQSCALSIVNGYDDTVGVIVEVAYRATGRSWRDQLNLERTPDSWLLNNVFYQGGGNLRFRLVEQAP